jgi:hypothetical protein
MKEISRRDFLEISGLGVVAFVLGKIPFLEEHADKFTPSFKYIGPYINSLTIKASEGERTGWIDPNDPDRILVGTWEKGIWQTVNGGKDWEQINVPVIKSEPFSEGQSSARDMLTVPGTGETLIVSDYSLAIGSLDDPSSWGKVNLPTDSYAAQTACILPDGRVIVGGVELIWPENKFTGIALTDIQTIKDTIAYNKSNPDSPKNVEWKAITGIFGDERLSYIRTIAHLPPTDAESSGKIFIGGWLGSTFENNGKIPGTGLVCMDDVNFKPILERSFPFEHKLYDAPAGPITGPMCVNSINALRYKGHEIIFVGGEGTGGGNSRIYHPDHPQFQIVVDGVAYPQEVVNCEGLMQSGGGSDCITPQKGIEICKETAEVYVSTAYREISQVSLDDVISGKVINWERITKPPSGQRDMGSLHIMISQGKESNKKPVLLVCRDIWGSGQLPFQQVAVADLTP